MDPVIIGSLGAILVLLGVVFMTLQSVNGSEASKVPPEERRRNIMTTFERRLEEKLSPYAGDEVALKIHKRELLKAFSKELEMNVMFDADEKKAMIAELAGFTPGQAS
jgi:hypothetical protein